MMDFEPIIVVTTTSDDQAELRRLAKHLVEHQFAACCQISAPIESVYRWNEQVEIAQEWMCAIKTTRSLYAEVESEILELHHYDQPQIVAVEIVEASPGYHDWVRAQVKSSEA